MQIAQSFFFFLFYFFPGSSLGTCPSYRLGTDERFPVFVSSLPWLKPELKVPGEEARGLENERETFKGLVEKV